MSADNGVYILVTEGPEYRVAHLQAVENVWYHYRFLDGEIISGNPDHHIANARQMWAGVPCFTEETPALQEAWRLLNELPICEYGISKIEIPRRF